jgi:hypothetical protein
LNVGFRNSFARDLRRIRDQALLSRVQQVIEQVEGVDSACCFGETKLGGRLLNGTLEIPFLPSEPVEEVETAEEN